MSEPLHVPLEWMTPVGRFLTLAKMAVDIAGSDASWETKYDLVFSDEISKCIRETGISLDYCDPDTSYEEDVLAYVNAVKVKAEDLGKTASGQ